VTEDLDRIVVAGWKLRFMEAESLTLRPVVRRLLDLAGDRGLSEEGLRDGVLALSFDLNQQANAAERDASTVRRALRSAADLVRDQDPYVNAAE